MNLSNSGDKYMKKKIIVGLSGGRDSAVAALLLHRNGWDVTAVYLKLFSDAVSDSGKLHENDARNVSEFLDIPFRKIDISQRFETEVLRRFVQEYLNGRTPNPCIYCNPLVKFKALLEEADNLGIDYIATGHYVRTSHTPGSSSPLLLKAKDLSKDQSYFLSRLTPKQIAGFIAPLGELSFRKTINFAREAKLPITEKPSSQEICFVSRHYSEFLLSRKEAADYIKEGEIVHTNGKVIGTHRGLPFYTIGQRSGLGIAWEHPLYVIRIDTMNNRLIVGPQDETFTETFQAEDINWIRKPEGRESFHCDIKIRHRHNPTPAKVQIHNNSKKIKVVFEKPQRAVTPGQTAALYDGDAVLGSGIISL